jgi:hypothetical protein
MKKANRALALPLSLAATSSWAHSGHGMPGESHWHAGDVAIFVVLGLAAALVIWWFAGGRK